MSQTISHGISHKVYDILHTFSLAGGMALNARCFEDRCVLLVTLAFRIFCYNYIHFFKTLFIKIYNGSSDLDLCYFFPQVLRNKFNLNNPMIPPDC